MGFAFIILFCAILLDLFKMPKVALTLTVCFLAIVSFCSLMLYMSVPLGGK